LYQSQNAMGNSQSHEKPIFEIRVEFINRKSHILIVHFGVKAA